jgi:hypothetical protein
MAGTRKNGELANLKEIEGHPGLYTFINISRNPRKEKALLAKIARDARKLREETYTARIPSKSAG